MFNRNYIVGVFLYSLSGFIQVGFSTIVTLYAFGSKSEGGLEWTNEVYIGMAFAIAGAINILI